MPATPHPLFGDALRAAAAPWREELGKSDRERLDALIDLAVIERIRLSDCLAKLFPDDETKKAQTALTSFRKRLNDAAAEAKPSLGLRFEVDTKKKNPPAERLCWFTGPDPAVAQAELYSQQVTADVPAQFVPPRGIATTSSAMAAGKKVVRFFLSYAHENKPLAEALVKELRTQFKPSKRYELDLWSDRDILVGKDWDASIKKAIEACEFGLLLVSPAFLGSKYISEAELPRFVRGQHSPKPVVPVGLVRVDFERHDLKGLEAHQLFLQPDRQGAGRFFDQLDASAKKREFVHALYLAVEKRLDDFFSPTRPAAPTPEDLADSVPFPEKYPHFQRTRGRAVVLGDLERLDKAAPSQARDALGEIEAWAANPNAPPFFALLGEYGIGKTTTLQQLTRDLLEKRKTDPTIPLPIYVDLRDYVGESKGSIPTTEQLLASVIERSWKLRDRTVTPKDILRLVQDEGALIIFDGLDEKIVHLPPDRARAFIRTLWGVLPDAARAQTAAGSQKRRGKLLISCRSHYFRDVWNQNSMLVGEDREGLARSQFPAFCLLPFTEEQVRDYLSSFLGGPERGQAAFDLIASIHNLRDLAERPYLLSLISEHLGELEELRTRGETVNAARLYDLVVRSWLNRDDGKHQLEPAHKRRLMEELAAALWREGSKQWDVDRLEEWLDQYLAENSALAAAYVNKDRAVLKEDLRTATFVLRPDTEEKHFRFAHTSLQEYFLAAYLARALNEGKSDRLDLPMVSLETLDFLGQILAIERRPAALPTLEGILGGEVLRAAVLAFRYWLRAIEQEWPEPAPAQVKLAGADLEEWTIRGRSATKPLSLRGADLSRAWLNRARVENVDLTEADLTGLEARQALFLKINAPRARAQGVDFCGLQWREGSLAGADLAGARLSGCRWIDVDCGKTALPEAWEHDVAVPPPRGMVPGELVVIHGHTWVRACAWSPDGQRLLSSSDDKTLKVWDASSGQCLLTLVGHTASVAACAWSPDGQRLLSGSDDSSLKVWDAASGQCLLTLEGHAAPVKGCAWSSDGQRLLSGSVDRTLKTWDAASGQCLRTHESHDSPVWTCALSPDGQRVLSGSTNKALKIWNASSGQCLLTLTGHASSVTACAWSPNGQRLLSGSDDHTLKVWDASSGHCLLTLDGPAASILACAWSPDGQYVLSGGSDKTLRVWDASSGHCLLTLEGHTASVRACAWSPDGQRLLSGSSDKALKVWDASSGHCLLTLKGHAASMWACAWSPDGQRLLSGSSDDTLKIWDASSGQCLLTLEGHADLVMACTWSPDGQRLLSGSSDDTLRVWDASSGQCLLTLEGHSDLVTTCAWSPDGQRLLSGSEDNTLKVWNASSGQCLLTIEGHTESVMACAWSPDGQRLLSGSDDSMLRIWDASSGDCLLSLEGHVGWVMACAWSPNGRYLLSSASDKTLKIWDASSGKCLLTIEWRGAWVRTCAWSPDGQHLLSGSDDNTLKVWDASSGQCLLTLTGHVASVRACAWSPDGQRLLSVSSDKTLKVWDASSGQCLWTGHLFPEGQTVAIDEVNGRLLSASPEAWRWLAWRTIDPATGDIRLLPVVTP